MYYIYNKTILSGEKYRLPDIFVNFNNLSEEKMQRESLKSRLGFILLSAGCAIGVGNVWKFPYITGQNGGGWFVLIYLVCLVAVGVPVMTMEFAMGRASRKSPASLYEPLEPKGSKWHIHSIFAVAGNVLLMMFYTTVAAWMLYYFYQTATGKFVGMDSDTIQGEFGNMLADPVPVIIFMAIVVVIGTIVCFFGVQKGLERVTKYMMIALLVIMVVLAVNSLFTEGGMEGFKFYLVPNAENIKNVGDGSMIKGLGKVIVAALNQSFFSLSIGMGSMAIFGSYIDKKRSLMGEAINVAVLDTFVAITAGLIIFPACFSFGIEPSSGPGLIFQTLPNIFNNMAGGRIWGSLFFIFMSFAALSTIFAIFEVLIASMMEKFGWDRKKACLINGAVIFVLSLPCIFGYNILSFITPFGEGTTILDIESFLVENLILPLGSLVFVIFCTCRYGWGWKNFVAEANEGKGLKVAKWMRGYMTFVLPVIVIILFAISMYNYFA